MKCMFTGFIKTKWQTNKYLGNTQELLKNANSVKLEAGYGHSTNQHRNQKFEILTDTMLGQDFTKSNSGLCIGSSVSAKVSSVSN